MRTKKQILLLLFLCGIAVYGCDAFSEDEEILPGTFSIQFLWGDEGPPDPSVYPELWAWSQVVHFEGETEENWAESELVEYAYSGETKLTFSRVLNSDNLVIRVSIVDEKSKDVLPVYYGESEPFSLQPGVDVIIKVNFSLNPTPHAPDLDGDGMPPVDGDGEFVDDPAYWGVLAIVDATGPAACPRCYINNPMVDLSFLAEAATRVAVSNDAAFDRGVQEREIGELDPDTGRYSWKDWDVNNGVCEPDEVGENCDGPHTVFIKFLNDSGFESEAYSTRATLDTVKPELSDGTALRPEIANAHSVVTLSINSKEELRRTPVVYVKPNDFAFDFDRKVGNVYTYTYDVDNQVRNRETYSFTADLMDLAGNMTKQVAISGTLFVDTVAPKITNVRIMNGSVEGDRFSAVAGFDVLNIEFDVGEDVGIEAPIDGSAGIEVALQVESDMRRLECARDDKSHYQCSYDITGDEGEGAHNLTIETEDAAGNVDASSHVVTFDFSPPVIATGNISLVLVPGPDSILTEVETVTNGTTVSLTFTVDEQLMEEPEVITSSEEEYFDFELGGGDQGNTYTFSDLAANLPAGLAYTEDLRIDNLIDLVGNQAGAPVEAASFEVDTVLSQTPDVNTGGKIIYRRIPWGANETRGEARYTVTGSSGAVNGAGTVIVYQPTPFSEVGRGKSVSDGSFEAIELQSNLPSVLLSFVDRAGNASETVEVKNIEWLASMGYKIVGSNVENPNAFESVPFFSDELEHPTAINADNPRNLATLDAGVIETHGAGQWTKLDATDARLEPAEPKARQGAAMAYDSRRSKVVLFGGYNPNGCDEDDGTRCTYTWEWNESGWSRVSTNDPDPRRDHAMAYDGNTDQVIMFGGWYEGGFEGENCTENSPLGDDGNCYDARTWGFNGSTWQIVGEGPAARMKHVLVYNSDSQHILLFGGISASDCGEDEDEWCQYTWKFSPSGWSVLASSGPEPRIDSAAAYDIDRSRIVLFGGSNQDGCQEGAGASCAYTWEWNGNAWSQYAVAAPPDMSEHVMAYDPSRRKTFAFGGDGSSRDSYDSAWEWDGQSWVQSTATGPVGRLDAAAAYDENLRVILVHGGMNLGDCGEGNGAYCGATWIWDGGGSHRPGQVMRVRFGDANASENDWITDVSVSWNAGGIGYPPGQCVQENGAIIQVWDTGDWQEIIGTVASNESPQNMWWSTSQDLDWLVYSGEELNSQIRRLMTGHDDTLSFGVTALEVNGCSDSYGIVRTGYAEVQVKYRKNAQEETDGDMDGDMDGDADSKSEDDSESDGDSEN